jgi:hypothetical protein
MSAAPAGASVAANGPSDTGSVTANVVVSSAITLTMLDESFTLRGFPGQEPELDNAVGYEVFTNNTGGYTVTVQPENANLVAHRSGNDDVIPITDLSVKEHPSSTWLQLDPDHPVQIYTQTTRSTESPGDVHSDDYKFNTPIPDVENDTYSDVIDYVATVNT